MNLNDYKTNPDLETQGIWVAFEDAEFLIAANQNPRHKKALAKLIKQNPALLRKSDLAAQESLAIEAMAEGILLDWKNVKDGETVLPYSRENAVRLLGFRVIRDFVSSQADLIENYRGEAEAEAAGNCKSGNPVAA